MEQGSAATLVIILEESHARALPNDAVTRTYDRGRVEFVIDSYVKSETTLDDPSAIYSISYIWGTFLFVRSRAQAAVSSPVFREELGNVKSIK
jgi:hypothetical protein